MRSSGTHLCTAARDPPHVSIATAHTSQGPAVDVGSFRLYIYMSAARRRAGTRRQFVVVAHNYTRGAGWRISTSGRGCLAESHINLTSWWASARSPRRSRTRAPPLRLASTAPPQELTRDDVDMPPSAGNGERRRGFSLAVTLAPASTSTRTASDCDWRATAHMQWARFFSHIFVYVGAVLEQRSQSASPVRRNAAAPPQRRSAVAVRRVDVRAGRDFALVQRPRSHFRYAQVPEERRRCRRRFSRCVASRGAPSPRAGARSCLTFSRARSRLLCSCNRDKIDSSASVSCASRKCLQVGLRGARGHANRGLAVLPHGSQTAAKTNCASGQSLGFKPAALCLLVSYRPLVIICSRLARELSRTWYKMLRICAVLVAGAAALQAPRQLLSSAPGWLNAATLEQPPACRAIYVRPRVDQISRHATSPPTASRRAAARPRRSSKLAGPIERADSPSSRASATSRCSERCPWRMWWALAARRPWAATRPSTTT